MLHRSSLVGFFVLGYLGLLLAQNPAAGRNYAFLVACSEYDQNELPKLPFTVLEMQEFKTVLEKTGFDPKDIKFMRDGAERRYIPERSKVLEEFKLLLARVEPKDTLLVALNGHGVHFRKDKSGYFCPLDANLSDKKTMIAMDDGEDNLFSLLKACKAKKKLLIVNACRNDPSSFGLAARKLEFDNESDEEVPEGIVGIYSCKPGQRSFYYNPADPKSPSKTRSLFFHHLIESWSGAHSKTGKVTLEEVFQHVKSKTATDADELHGRAQVPDIKREYAGEWLVRTKVASADENATAEAGSANQKLDQAEKRAKEAGLKAEAAEAKLRERLADPVVPASGEMLRRPEAVYESDTGKATHVGRPLSTGTRVRIVGVGKERYLIHCPEWGEKDGWVGRDHVKLIAPR